MFTFHFATVRHPYTYKYEIFYVYTNTYLLNVHKRLVS